MQDGPEVEDDGEAKNNELKNQGEEWKKQQDTDTGSMTDNNS